MRGLIKMSYYQDKKKANVKISDILESLKRNKAEGSINAIILYITNNYAVSEKAVIERINLINKVEENLVITGDSIKWL